MNEESPTQEQPVDESAQNSNNNPSEAESTSTTMAPDESTTTTTEQPQQEHETDIGTAYQVRKNSDGSTTSADSGTDEFPLPDEEAQENTQSNQLSPSPGDPIEIDSSGNIKDEANIHALTNADVVVESQPKPIEQKSEVPAKVGMFGAGAIALAGLASGISNRFHKKH